MVHKTTEAETGFERPTKPKHGPALQPWLHRLSSTTPRDSLAEYRRVATPDANEEAVLCQIEATYPKLVNEIRQAIAELQDESATELQGQNLLNLLQYLEQGLREFVAQESRDLSSFKDHVRDYRGISKEAVATAWLRYQAAHSKVFISFITDAQARGNWAYVYDALGVWNWMPGVISAINENLYELARSSWANYQTYPSGRDSYPVAPKVEDFRNWNNTRSKSWELTSTADGAGAVRDLLNSWLWAGTYIRDAHEALVGNRSVLLSHMQIHTTRLVFQPGLPLPDLGKNWPDTMTPILESLSKNEQWAYRRYIIRLSPQLEALRTKSTQLENPSKGTPGVGMGVPHVVQTSLPLFKPNRTRPDESEWIHGRHEDVPVQYCHGRDPSRPRGPVTGTRTQLGSICGYTDGNDDKSFRNALEVAATDDTATPDGPIIWLRHGAGRKLECFFLTEEKLIIGVKAQSRWNEQGTTEANGNERE